MTTTPPSLDIPAIVARALAAQPISPGPYTIQWVDRGEDEPADERGVDYILDANGDHVIVGDSGVYPPHGPVALHIAGCDPTTVLALTGRIAALEDELHRLRGSHQRSIEATREAVTGLDDHGRAHMVVACRAAVTRCFCGCHVSTTDEATTLRNLATNTESKEGK